MSIVLSSLLRLQILSLFYISSLSLLSTKTTILVQAFNVLLPVPENSITSSSLSSLSSSSSSLLVKPKLFQQRRQTLFNILLHGRSSSSSSSSLDLTVSDRNDDSNEKKQTYTLQITHENQNATITIEESESILSALERVKTQQHQPNQSYENNNNDNDNNNDNVDGQKSSNNFLSSLPALPQDCRKGNCLTCAAVHLPNSNKNSVVTLDDGLAPVVRKAVDEKGYVQTCSSYVVGEGVVLGLGVCHDVWDNVWNCRVNDEVGEQIRFEAMAKTMRLADERNVKKWAKKTERMLDS